MLRTILLTLIIALALPTSAATKRKTSSSKSNRMVNVETAVKAWNAKPRKDETTASMEARLRKDISTLLAKDRDKLDYDVARWRLLSYLRELKWEDLSSSWKSWYLANMPNPRLTEDQRAAYIEQIKDKKLYQMSPKEVDVYLAYTKEKYSDLRERVVHLARKNLGQPYKIYLLGEFPYEVYDADPLYSLKTSDCVVFSEHTYAMALSDNWSDFFKMLQKIRYKDGEVGMVTRNHYTEADWNKNNAWLIEDVTSKIDATTVTDFRERIDRAAFFRNFGIGQDFKVETLHDNYIPASAVKSVLPKLKDGDFVNVVRGIGDGVWVGHVGLIGHKPDGTVTFIHSTEPQVKEQSIMEYVNDNVKKNVQRRKDGKAEFKGFKFLRLRADELQSRQTAMKP